MLNDSTHYKYCVYIIYDDFSKMIYTEVCSSVRLLYKDLYFRVKQLHPECFTRSIDAFDYREVVYFD